MGKKSKQTINKSNFFYYTGNIFIAFSLFGFLLLLFPLIWVYLLPPKINTHLPNQGFFIPIPKIHAQAPVTENVDPWNEAAYGSVLQHSVAHAKGTSLPGQAGTIFLFAHSSGSPWEQTWFNTIFVRLGELQKGDQILLERNGKIYRYKVRESKIISPNQVNYLLQTRQRQLILQTCWPIGTSWKRLLVFADLVANGK